MKIYNYRNGDHAIFINNEKIVLTEKERQIIENLPLFPKEMFKEVTGKERVAFVQDSDADTLALVRATEMHRFVNTDYPTMKDRNFDVTFLSYKGNVFGVFGDYENQDASCLKRFDLNQVMEEFKNTCK